MSSDYASSDSKANIKVFTGNANPELAQEMANYLGIPLGNADVKKFSDGEISVSIEESVRGKDVFLVQPICAPNINDNLLELLIMADAVRRASAARINAVIPYYGYARQDRKSKAREPITAKLIADLLSRVGMDRIITMDLHAAQIPGFFDIPVDHLPGVAALSQYCIQAGYSGNCTVLSPDVGGVTRARDLATRLDAPLAIIDKRRPKPNVAEVMNIIGKIEGERVIIIDDIIDTAGTITNAAKAMMDKGAKEVILCATHAVLSGAALKNLAQAPVKEIILTNTIPIRPEDRLPNMKILSIAPLMGEAIQRIHDDMPISEMFQKYKQVKILGGNN